MDDQSIRRLMIDVALTQDEELDCVSVEPHLEEAAAGGRMSADLDAHLRRCAPCREVFDSLQAMAAFEAADDLPAIDLLWEQLRPLTRDGATTAQPAIEASPRAVAPRPVALDVNTSQGWFTRLSNALFGPTPSFAPAALSLALVLAGVGWWQALETRGAVADLRAEVSELQVTAAEADETMKMVALVNRSNFAQAENGSWARIIYHNDLDQGMVYAGELPELAEGQEIACWLIDDEGNAVLAWQGDEFEGSAEQSWWPVEVEGSMGDFNAMRITLEPTHDTVIEIPFSEQNS
jgi:hypothetical protein